jgi:quercetin dioxygenase-like cupin family protein
MSFQLRRIVTGHDGEGLAVVKANEVLRSEPRRPGYEALVAWCTDQLPCDNSEESYTGGTPGKKGSRVLLRVGEMVPGEHTPVMHRTETLDYAIILSGEMELSLDGGQIETLTAGDIVIQRGTNHAWRPVGSAPVKVLFILIDAEPIVIDGKVLSDFLDNFAGSISPMPST